jgi:hypothetical protein
VCPGEIRLTEVRRRQISRPSSPERDGERAVIKELVREELEKRRCPCILQPPGRNDIVIFAPYQPPKRHRMKITVTKTRTPSAPSGQGPETLKKHTMFPSRVPAQEPQSRRVSTPRCGSLPSTSSLCGTEVHTFDPVFLNTLILLRFANGVNPHRGKRLAHRRWRWGLPSRSVL